MGISGLSGPIRLGCLAAAMLLSAGACAGEIEIENAWVRATAPGQAVAALDMTLSSRRDTALTGVSSGASRSVELHSMTHENGMMKMRVVKAIELPAGKRLDLGASGYHLMLTGLKAPLRAGETVSLTLTFGLAGQRTESIEVAAKVRPLTATGATSQQGGHAQHHH